MKIYIATPINARSERTFAEKQRAARQRCKLLKSIIADDYDKDTEIVSFLDAVPTTAGMQEHEVSESEALGRCISLLLTCDAIYLDHAWQSSKGCNLEYRAAKIYGLDILEHDKI